MLSKSPRIAIPSGPVVRASAAMAFATASSAGAAATASWFDSPRQISPSRAIASRCARSDGHRRHDRDAEVAHVPGRLLERGGVDPQKRQRSPVAKEVRGDRRALGFRHIGRQRLLNGDDALIERQALQLGRRQVQPRQRLHRRSAAPRCLGEAAWSASWWPVRSRPSTRRPARPPRSAPARSRRSCAAIAPSWPGCRPVRDWSGSSPRLRPGRPRPQRRPPASPLGKSPRAGRWPPPSRATAARSRDCRPRRRPRVRRAPAGRRPPRAGR